LLASERAREQVLGSGSRASGRASKRELMKRPPRDKQTTSKQLKPKWNKPVCTCDFRDSISGTIAGAFSETISDTFSGALSDTIAGTFSETISETLSGAISGTFRERFGKRFREGFNFYPLALWAPIRILIETHLAFHFWSRIAEASNKQQSNKPHRNNWERLRSKAALRTPNISNHEIQISTLNIKPKALRLTSSRERANKQSNIQRARSNPGSKQNKTILNKI
jgi:hypothetical protein